MQLRKSWKQKGLSLVRADNEQECQQSVVENTWELVHTDEGSRKDHEGGFADTHSHAAHQDAPETPGSCTGSHSQRPYQQSSAHELESLHMVAQESKGGASNDEADHKGCRQASIPKAAERKVTLYPNCPAS
jgi:hypothetical protein